MRLHWTVSLVAFGRPSDPATFSGYACSLWRALNDEQRLRLELSSRNLHLTDCLRGALALHSSFRLAISRKWMWSRTGHDALSARLNRLIEQAGDRGPFLEIGTLVSISEQFGPHYQLTDMTIAQARRAGFFKVGRLSSRLLTEAERLQSEIVAGARHVFALSDWAADSLRHDCGLPSDRVSVVYAGPNLHVESRSTSARADSEILFVGLDWKRKGGPLLLEAFETLRRRLPRATLRIIGCAPPIRDSSIIVDGYLDRRNPDQFRRLRHAYAVASCFCLPSAFDPFPNAIIEAMSAGLPVVAFDSGSRREAVIHGESGLLVPDGDVDALSEALFAILHGREIRDRMAQTARAFARSRFTWQGVVQRLADVIGAAQS
jgi:glycosyltransferase involved in cell wall biosynthesis